MGLALFTIINFPDPDKQEQLYNEIHRFTEELRPYENRFIDGDMNADTQKELTKDISKLAYDLYELNGRYSKDAKINPYRAFMRDKEFEKLWADLRKNVSKLYKLTNKSSNQNVRSSIALALTDVRIDLEYIENRLRNVEN